VLSNEICEFNNTMLHIVCDGFRKEDTLFYVKQAISKGIKNILALKGDDPIGGAYTHDRHYAIDLVQWTRELQNNDLTVVVAGHPLGHPNASNYTEHLLHLKRKVEAGADLIVTQFFFETQVFAQFQQDCRRCGINVPILPGILLFRVSIKFQELYYVMSSEIRFLRVRVLKMLVTDGVQF
jgi:methylenetetrahydrofolate reductase (NADPH)